MQVGLPIGAFIAALLVLIPLPWHWRARNIATLSIIAWLFISNLIFAINSIIWANTVLNVAPIWCDISTKLQMGANMALPACCLCVCIHLERIASVRQVRTMHAEKLRRMFFDAALCWGLPIIYMALHYIVQGHRFDIVEEFGCRPTIYVSIPAIFLIWVPPMVAALLTLAYAGVALVHFFRRRLTFAKHLQDSTSGLTSSRYFRLMCMSVLQMVWGLLVTSLNMWFTCQHGLRPWISWANVHDGFSQIAYFPTVLIPQSTLTWTFALWWTVPVSSVFFFAFFSFGEEAMKEYRGCISWLPVQPHHLLASPSHAFIVEFALCAIPQVSPATPMQRLNPQVREKRVNPTRKSARIIVQDRIQKQFNVKVEAANEYVPPTGTVTDRRGRFQDAESFEKFSVAQVFRTLGLSRHRRTGNIHSCLNRRLSAQNQYLIEVAAIISSNEAATVNDFNFKCFM
ncbi:pheromone A receptor-domain-containing protein [Hygrophoropsis aurantiaca]|uniref:Pheromone A receptor-domain-containing protein n=1 Tax=Hygrophoropsis aurantiaca TaxID=72124 RepID=A0ACB7ZW51_9AGAM|nr:pheromone A receptor-domain-containing protein [Hygrophoropsis aurantiaca]